MILIFVVAPPGQTEIFSAGNNIVVTAECQKLEIIGVFANFW
jgi:hypothetical protein